MCSLKPVAAQRSNGNDCSSYLILTVFSLLFWAFFEQAGSSMANFIDRNIDRVFELRDFKRLMLA